MIPLVGFAFQGSGDEEDLAAAATEEPLPVTVAEELDSSPPERPPLPIPTVASERGVTLVSGIEGQGFGVACLNGEEKERPESWEGPAPGLLGGGFHFGSSSSRFGHLRVMQPGNTQEAAGCRGKSKRQKARAPGFMTQIVPKFK